jgi:DNA-binding response OmpR family regulator
VARHLLIVDDDALFRRSLAFNLEQAGYRVSSSADAENAVALARRDRPDLILLDIGLPGMDGLEALPQFRAELGSPVIFITSRRRALDQVLGLELGAVDYITKPFDMDVLMARIKARLREGPAAAVRQPVPIRIGDLEIDPAAHTVTVAGDPVDLPPRAFDLLYVLAQEAGNVVRSEDLLARVWGAEFAGEPQVVYVHIRWLRQRLEPDPSHPRRILTVRGVGYKLVPAED